MQELEFDSGWLARKLEERMTRYAKVWTTSDKKVTATPTSGGQRVLAAMLADELGAMGVSDVRMTEHSYVLARIPAVPAHAAGKLPVIGFLAHLDTSSEVSGENVVPVVERDYDGGLIALAGGVNLDPASDAELAAQRGKTIIHSDGRTLLGADDKAGIAEIMTAAEWLLTHSETEHGEIEIVFTPDEETGAGLPCLPRESMKAAYCYTLDGGGAGEIEVECFNAYGVDVYFSGKVIHPGAARGILVNAALMAAHFAAMLPRSESPEATDGYYGYYCLMEMSGNQESAHAELIVRDFSRDGMARRIAALESFARATEAAFPGGTAHVEAKPTYYNMKEKIDAAPAVLDKLLEACRRAGVEPRLKPIRGGTDGSRLTELGIPTPNIWTGGRNFHSKTEWVSLDEMVQAAKVVVELARLWGKP